ncbi:coiled-coil domain-containing protein [Legionella tunisiensis]|uniref:hypothetical protein n=1 Tax=Legionella tunisiensis TaxID=1034944 RepID=UPI0012E9F5B3|nr:hypothetical protein [Legionella tunisiensis]
MSPRIEIPMVPIVAIQLPPGIMQEVARQTSDLNELIAALASDREAVRELQEQVEELTEAQESLAEELRLEKLAVAEARETQVKTAKQLQETESTVHRLEEDAERLIATHNEKVELLEKAIAKKDEASEQAALDLEQERLEHRNALDDLASRLSTAENTRDELSEKLEKQSIELQSSILNAERLSKEVLSLESRNSDLQKELSSSKDETEEVRSKMQLALEKQLAATNLAKQEASTHLESLESLRVEHSKQSLRVEELEATNSELHDQIEEISEIVRQKDLEIQAERREKEQQELLAAERLVELQRLQETLRAVAEQKALLVLKPLIETSRDVDLLNAICDEDKAELDLAAIGWNGYAAEVAAIGDIAWQQIENAADLRLTALSQQASNALKAKIQDSTDLVALRGIADAESNDELEVGAGFDEHVGFLRGVDAYEAIKDEAELRLATLDLEAQDALIAAINDSHDAALLDRVANVDSNVDLRGTGLTVGHVDALNRLDAYMDIKAVAQERIDANQDAIVALTDFINGCEDAQFLEAVTRVTTNGRLEAAFDLFGKGNADHLQALIKVDAYTQFVDLARARLLALDAARHRRPDEPDPRIIAQEKAVHALKREIAISKDGRLLTEIARATSNEELNHNWHQLDELNLHNIQALVQDDAYERVRDAADARLDFLVADRNQKRDKYADPMQYAATLLADETTLKGINQRVGAIGTVDKKVRSELRQLGAMNPMHWFSPAFRGAAKKNAIAMEAHFTALATTCKVIVDYLVPLRNELNEQLASIPADTSMFSQEQRSALEGRRALLNRYLEKVDAELELYKPVYEQLYGDPRAREQVLKDGILKTIRRAKTDEGALEVFPFKSATQDHLMDERAAHFRAGYTSSATAVSARSTTLGLGAHQARYAAGDAFKAGHFREHTINPDAARTGRYSGCYIEERASSYRTSLANASEYLADLKLTITQFPEAPLGVAEDDPQLVEDRIHFALACAVTLLSAFSDPPTESNPVVLRGFEEKEMRYIWTALMVLGSEIPSMQFSHKAINVISPTFKPANELGMFYGYSNSSCHETLFKPHKAYVDGLLKGIKEACAQRVAHQKTLEKADKLATSISSTYKSTFKQTLDELREQQDKGPEIFGR